MTEYLSLGYTARPIKPMILISPQATAISITVGLTHAVSTGVVYANTTKVGSRVTEARRM